MNNKKGFTLVELLAVIVILAIIMIIAIPAVLSTMETARKKSLVEYANKAVLKAEEKYTTRSLEGLPIRGVIVYDIVSDFDFNNTGDYKGYVLIDATETDKRSFYVYLYDNSYLINLKKSTDISVESLEDVESIEVIASIEKLVDIAGFNSYYDASSSIVNEIKNPKYEFLNGLKLDGHKYINTQVIPTDNTKIELEIDDNNFDAIMGSRTIYKSEDSLAIFGQFTSTYVNYIIYWGDKSVSLNKKNPSVSPIKVTFDNKTFKVNEKEYSVLNPTVNLKAKYPMFLFSVSNGGAPDYRVFQGTFYSCKIYENGKLIRNFVPVKVKATGETTIYEKVEKKEYSFIKYN